MHMLAVAAFRWIIFARAVFGALGTILSVSYAILMLIPAGPIAFIFLLPVVLTLGFVFLYFWKESANVGSWVRMAESVLFPGSTDVLDLLEGKPETWAAYKSRHTILLSARLVQYFVELLFINSIILGLPEVPRPAWLAFAGVSCLACGTLLTSYQFNWLHGSHHVHEWVPPAIGVPLRQLGAVFASPVVLFLVFTSSIMVGIDVAGDWSMTVQAGAVVSLLVVIWLLLRDPVPARRPWMGHIAVVIPWAAAYVFGMVMSVWVMVLVRVLFFQSAPPLKTSTYLELLTLFMVSGLSLLHFILGRTYPDLATLWTSRAHAACSVDDVNELRQLIEEPQRTVVVVGEDIPLSGAASCDSQGATPLHLAASSGGAECTRLLLEHFPSTPTTTDLRNFLPVHCAVHSGSPEALALLLTSPDFVTAKAGEHQDTLLHLAARRGNEAITRACLQALSTLDLGLEPQALSTMNAQQQTPLDVAVHRRRGTVASILLQRMRELRIVTQHNEETVNTLPKGPGPWFERCGLAPEW